MTCTTMTNVKLKVLMEVSIKTRNLVWLIIPPVDDMVSATPAIFTFPFDKAESYWPV